MNLIKAALLSVLSVSLASSAHAGPMTKLERQRLVAHLELTESWLVEVTATLSPEQLKFRPSPGAWSISDVVEHLVIAEPQYWDEFQQAMKKPPAKPTGQVSDADVLWYGVFRGDRQKTDPFREPKGQLASLQAGLDSFHKTRAKMLAYTRTTDEDLRGHVYGSGEADAYQWMLDISTHAQRHIMQIREIKSNPNFPKS
jgi:uncharacterized damage-inducible protein DinB